MTTHIKQLINSIIRDAGSAHTPVCIQDLYDIRNAIHAKALHIITCTPDNSPQDHTTIRYVGKTGTFVIQQDTEEGHFVIFNPDTV